MKKKIIIGLIVFVVLLIIFIPYLKEYKYYKKACDSNNLDNHELYLKKYPDGKYSNEIKEKQENIAFRNVQQEQSELAYDYYNSHFPQGKHIEEVDYLHIGFSLNPITAISCYLTKYPNGVYKDSLRIVNDRLWNEEIEKYHEKNKQLRLTAKAKTYMDEMLVYMRENFLNTISVEINSTVKLKDYKEYPQDVRDFLEMLNDNPQLSLEEGMISLKSNFTQADLQSLREILLNGLQHSFDAIFTPGFINVVTEKDEKSPKITINYKIQSQEDMIGSTAIPHIWTYVEYADGYQSTQMNHVKNYLIGISINFDTNYSIPNSSTTFNSYGVGQPENDINNIDDIRDGYRKMTTICFKQFANQITKSLGLTETYQKN